MPVAIRNTQSGPTVFTDKHTETSIEWQGKGDVSGGDIQVVPDSLLDNVNFMRVIARGILVTETADKSIEQALSVHRAAWEQKEEAQKRHSQMTIENAEKKDFVSTACIGPSARGTGECGEPVPVRETQVGEKPPLCSKHEMLASQYVVTETEEIKNGEALKQWNRVHVDPRTTAAV